jgi:hypothetical protein
MTRITPKEPSYIQLIGAQEIILCSLQDHAPLKTFVAFSTQHDCAIGNPEKARDVMRDNDCGCPNSAS